MNRAYWHLTFAAFALFLAGAAQADDWPQFRKDAGRSAVSNDKLVFPLAEQWKWSTRGQSGHTPLFNAVVWKNSVYFTASDKKQRFLICANANTGKVMWKKLLKTEQLRFALSDTAVPPASSNSTVIVFFSTCYHPRSLTSPPHHA